QYGAADGKTETARNSDQYQNGVNQVNRLRGAPTDGQEQRRAQTITDIAPHQQLAAVEEIGGVSGDQKQDKAGRELGQADISEIEWTVGDGVNLPSHCYGLHLDRYKDEKTRECVVDEVGIVEGDPRLAGRVAFHYPNF